MSIHFNHAYNYSRYLAWVFHLVDVYIFIRLCIIGHEGRCSLCLVARFQRFLLLIKRLKDLSDRMRGALSRNTGKKYWVSKWVFKFERKPEILKNDLKRKLHFIVCEIKLIKIRFTFMNYWNLLKWKGKYFLVRWWKFLCD